MTTQLEIPQPHKRVHQTTDAQPFVEWLERTGGNAKTFAEDIGYTPKAVQNWIDKGQMPVWVDEFLSLHGEIASLSERLLQAKSNRRSVVISGNGEDIRALSEFLGSSKFTIQPLDL